MNKFFRLEQKMHLATASATSVRVAKVALLMAVVLALGGCSANSEAGLAKSADASAKSEVASASANGGGDATGKTAENSSGQGQAGTQKGGFVRADLMGEVKSIIGNSVTLALAKVPTRESGTGTQGGAPPTGGELPAGGTPPTGADMPSGGGTPPAGGEIPSGGGAAPQGGGAPANGSAPSGSNGQSSGGQKSGNPGTGGQGGSGSNGSSGTRRAMSLTLTGETKEILIPVGISITSGNGDNAKTIDIADIEKGDVLMIYYVEGTEDIEKITVR